MKKFFAIAVCWVLFSQVFGQATATEVFNGELPGVRNREAFYKICWVTSKSTREATLRDVIIVDSVKRTVTRLQIRNDNKIDSSVATYKTFSPVFTSTKSRTFFSSFTFLADRVDYIIENAGSTKEVGQEQMKERYFDPFMGEFLIGLLPLKPGYKIKIPFYMSKKGLIYWEITEVINDVLLTSSGRLQVVCMLKLNVPGAIGTMWVDTVTKEVIKVLYQLPDGGVFVKYRV